MNYTLTCVRMKTLNNLTIRSYQADEDYCMVVYRQYFTIGISYSAHLRPTVL